MVGPEIAAACTAVSGFWVMALPDLGSFSASLEEDAALLATVGGWGSETACRRSQAPLLDICLDEDEAGLPKVHMHRARSVGSDGWEQVLRLETVGHVFQLLAVPREEYRARAGTVADADHIALCEGRPVRRPIERLVVSPLSRGRIRHGILVPAYASR